MRLVFTLLCLAVATIIVSSCSKDGDYHSHSSTHIPLHSSIQLGSNNAVSLSFDELISDSRCPVNSLCTWAGIAIAKFTLKTNSTEIPLMMSVMPGYPKQDTIVNGYYIEFSDLTPYPGLSAEKQNQQSLQAEMRIQRLK